jgi:hypothetical protein
VIVGGQAKEPIVLKWAAAKRRSASDEASQNGFIGSFHLIRLSNTAEANFTISYQYYITGLIGLIKGGLEID